MDLNKIANFFFELASMRRIKRAHSQVIQEADDNISDHSFRVAIIGMILAKIENCDVNKVMKMCLFHDLAEIRTGDANFINHQYLTIHETKARSDQMVGLPIGDEVLEFLREFEQRETKESLVAKDADLLDQMILQREYFKDDEKNHLIWQRHTAHSLKIEATKKLAQAIQTTNPFEWLYQLAETKARIKVDR
jgi:putative hydrolase of HD superfamily